MFEWLETANQNYVTVATALIALLLTVVVARYAMIPYYAAKREKRILDTRTWDRILASLQTDRAARYFGAIEASVGWFDRVYGPKVLGWRAFDRALMFAVYYAFLTLLIGWVLFDAGSLGGDYFLPGQMPLWQRAAIFVTILVSASIAFAAVQFETVITSWMTTHFQNQLMTHYRLSVEKMIQHGRYLLLAITTAGAVAVGIVLAGSGTGAIAFCLIFLVFLGRRSGIDGFAMIAVTAPLFTSIMFFAIAGLSSKESFPFFHFNNLELDGTVPITIGESNFAPAVLMLFLSFLPLLNAVADFISIAATRHFLRRIAAHRSGAWAVLGGVMFDLCIATICLALLLGSIILTLEAWGRLLPATLPIDWRAYRDELCAGDWQRGTMLWLMLSTTLAPTALHLAAGFGAVFAHSAQIDGKIAAILRPARDALVAKYGAVAFETDYEARAKSVLNADVRHSLEDLLGQKEGAQRWLTVALFIGFMVLMMGAVILAARHFALPQLCPGP